MRPIGFDDAAQFYIYNSHYKASQDTPPSTTNQDRRNAEAIAIRNNSNALGDGAHVIYAGDHNLYTAAEPAFQTLIAAGSGQAVDPLNLTTVDPSPSIKGNGEWNTNSAVAFAHTQSPCTTANAGCGVGGGMDDRFDFQLTTGEFLDSEGLAYIGGSYHAFGNNGTTYNTAINSRQQHASPFPGVTSYTKSQILGALATVTDHIPVVVDYQLPAKMSVAVGSIPARVIQGGTATIDVTVTNSAPVQFANGADELDFTVSGTGAVSGSDSGIANPLALGTVKSLLLSPVGPAGTKTGSVNVASTSQGAANPNFSQPVSVDLLDHANASFVAGEDQDSLTIDFGQIVAGSGTQMQSFDIFNLVATAGYTALLDLDLITPAGDTGVLSTDVATFANLAAGASHSFSAVFDPTSPGEFSSTYTFGLSDENLPGATGQTDLVLTLVGEVLAAGLLGDFNNDHIVNAADYTVWRNDLRRCGRLESQREW